MSYIGDVICDKCHTEMDMFDENNYYCDECRRHAYVSDDGDIYYDDDDDPDWMGKDDIDWDDVFD